jgi:hypothetical protein
MTTDVDRFLSLWFSVCPEQQLLEVRALNKSPGKRPMPQAWVKDAKAAAEYIGRCVEHGDDVYVGALPRTRASGTTDAVGARRWLWGDIDYGTVGHKTAPVHATREAALLAVEPFPPTMLVDTGGGFHAWWLLFDNAPPDEWAGAMRRLAAATGADANTLDPPRILRVPGTQNFKTTPARPVSIAATGDGIAGGRRVYSLTTFLALPLPLPLLPPRRQSSPFDSANDVPIADVLAWLGVKMHREGSRVYCACPVHGGSNDHQMAVGGESNVATCFGDCAGKAYTGVDIAAAVHKVTPRAAVDLLAVRFGFDGFAKRTRAKQQAAPVSDSGDWKAKLSKAKDGTTKPTLANVEMILRCAPGFAGMLRSNLMTLRYEFNGVPIGDGDLTLLRIELERSMGVTVSATTAFEAVQAVAEGHAYHPVQLYLDNLTWDRTPRLAHVGREILGSEDAAMCNMMLRLWFISAVARGRSPGCKVDTALVLAGPQGYYKSSFFRVLGGQWFSDTAFDLGNKDAYLQLARAWVYECSEIDAMISHKHAGQIKSFITSQVDAFRRPYGRDVSDVPRGCVIVGTTNEQRFLVDSSGSRRFWVVPVGRAVDIARLAEWRDQLWAEASHAYRLGERWWLEAEEESVRERAADDHYAVDPWEDIISTWLDMHRELNEVTTQTLLSGVLELDASQQTNAAMQRVGRLMRRLNYTVSRKRGSNAGIRRVWAKTRSAGLPSTVDVRPTTEQLM